MPAKNRVGRDERCELTQQAAPKPLAEYRETAPLIVV
jgi:hypothetical protein